MKNAGWLGPVSFSRTLITAAALCLMGVGSPACAGPRDVTYLYVGSYTSKQPGPGTDRVNPIGLSVFRVDKRTGGLAPVQEVKSDDPSFVALHPSRKFLYVNNEVHDYQGKNSGSVEAYAIDPNNGKLTLINRQSLNSPTPSQLAVDPSGRHLVVSSFIGGDYIVLPLGVDGAVGPVSDSLKNVGSGPDKSRQESAHPHGVTFSPDGKFIAGVDLGIDKVQVFRLEHGKLVQTSEVLVQPGSGPRHSVFGVDGSFLYVVNELKATITVFPFDGKTGMIGKEAQTISTYPENYAEFKNAAEIVVHPSGKFVYASNRPDASIVGFRVDAKNGTLSRIGFTKKGVEFPRTFTIDPTGEWLYSANQTADNIMKYKIDQNTGALTTTGDATTTRTPVTMVFRPGG